MAQGWAGRQSVQFQQPMKNHRRRRLPSEGISLVFSLPTSARTGGPLQPREFQNLRANSMTTNHRPQAAMTRQNNRPPNCSTAAFLPHRTTSTKTIRRAGPITEKELVMELRVQLKVCEGCGCLWLRAQSQQTVYCRECDQKLKDFPTPESRKRRGRPSRKPPARVFASVESLRAMGGAQ